ncbi:hypothetical protein, partial [uncultured Bacteroides sp.]|uniref:hypothetical protein n=1 Tax=uncultured Bacteroides sp. TaxID=162156 RepID=UPI0026755EE7
RLHRYHLTHLSILCLEHYAIVLILNGDIRLFIPNTKVIEVKNSVTAKNYHWEYVKNVNLPFRMEKRLFSQGLVL